MFMLKATRALWSVDFTIHVDVPSALYDLDKLQCLIRFSKDAAAGLAL